MSIERVPDKLKVSVCVVTYNQVEYIRQCLQSIVDQITSFRFEIIVGDDCSTDGTREAVREFSDRYPQIVRPLFHEQNVGPYENYLRVHEIAVGEFVAHVDGDDYTLPGKLQAQADALDRDSGCNAVWHRADFFDDEGQFCSGRTADLTSFERGRVTFGDAIRLGYIGVHSALMYRRAARSVIDTSRKILDVYVTWDVLSKGHGHIIDVVLGRYRVGSSGSLTKASPRGVHLLAIEHANEFLARFPQHRRDFFVWAMCRALVDAKNRRRTAFDYLGLAWRARSFVHPAELAANLQRMRRTQVRWRQQRQLRQEPRVAGS